jgi:predicted nucleotidyltransferase
MPDTDRQLILSAARDALLAAFPNAWTIYVYGSFARGDESPASDIDLAVLLPEEESIDDLMGVMSAVSAHVHREVDLVDLRKVGDVLRREVLAEGHTLYISRPDAVLEWEGNAISRYQHYREEIRDLLEDFQKTGIGYGS